MAVVLGHSIGHQITPGPCHSDLLNVLLSSVLLYPFLAASRQWRVWQGYDSPSVRMPLAFFFSLFAMLTSFQSFTGDDDEEFLKIS